MGVLRDYAETETYYAKWKLAKYFYQGIFWLILIIFYFSCHHDTDPSRKTSADSARKAPAHNTVKKAKRHQAVEHEDDDQ